MTGFYTNKTVWLTGASSGIGEAMALQLAKQGAELILSSENKEELERVNNLCLQETAKSEAVVLDLSNIDSIKQTLEYILPKYKKIDVLLLNAGISQRASTVDTSQEVHDRIMQINFHANVLITKAILPLMLKQGVGHIGVTSSISGKFGFHLRSAYAASKHALHGFFESVMLENREDKVFVTIVCPGRVKTKISLHALEADGKQHGKMDDGQAGGISSERCASKYLKAVRKRKREKLIGGKEILMVYFKRYVPWLFYYMSKRIKST